MKFAFLNDNLQRLFVASSVAIMMGAFIASALIKGKRRENEANENSKDNSSRSSRKNRASAIHIQEKRTMTESMIKAKPRTFLSDNDKDDDESNNSDIFESKIDLNKSRKKIPQGKAGLSKNVIYYSDNEQTAKMKSTLAKKLASENHKMYELYFAVFKKLES